jgi:hypothetical protein
MRKVLISILLAAAASPALAYPHDDSDRQQAREERQQAREDRQQAREQARPERPANGERPQMVAPAFVGRQANQPPQQMQQSFVGHQRFQEMQAARAQRVDQRQQRVEQLRDNRELRQSTRATPRVFRNRVPVVSDVPRPGTQPPARVSSYSHPNWSTSWRNNSRYDWQNYRHHHRSLFSLGFYYDPFGWGYQPYQIGWRLWPDYYSSRYWISDPWQYRLPYAPPGTQWIRYWNDALLVDMWSGQVVDVIPGFFW